MLEYFAIHLNVALDYKLSSFANSFYDLSFVKFSYLPVHVQTFTDLTQFLYKYNVHYYIFIHVIK